MRALILLLCLMFWGLVITVVDAWSLPQRSTRKVSNMMSLPVPITSYYVANDYATEQEFRRMMNASVAYLRNEGIRAVWRKRNRLPDVFKKDRLYGPDFDVFMLEFTHYRNILKQSGAFKGVGVNYVGAPPWHVNGTRYMAGFAYLDSTSWNGLAYSVVQMSNTSGLNRYRHSIVGIVHEILHVIGCRHEPGVNVMHENAFVVHDIHFEPKGQILPVGPECKKTIAKFAKDFRR